MTKKHFLTTIFNEQNFKSEDLEKILSSHHIIVKLKDETEETW